jgi:hypothetical protein
MHEPGIPAELEGWPKATRRENIGLLSRLRYEWKHLSPDAQKDGLVFQNYAGLFWRVMCLDTMQKQQELVEPLYDSYDRLCDLAENLTGGYADWAPTGGQRCRYCGGRSRKG